MGGYFVDVCMQYPSVWTHLQRPDICVQISGMFAPNILERRSTAVTRYVPHIPGNISANVADGVCSCICTPGRLKSAPPLQGCQCARAYTTVMSSTTSGWLFRLSSPTGFSLNVAPLASYQYTTVKIVHCTDCSTVHTCQYTTRLMPAPLTYMESSWVRMKQSSMLVPPKGLMPSPLARQVKILVHFTCVGRSRS